MPPMGSQQSPIQTARSAHGLAEECAGNGTNTEAKDQRMGNPHPGEISEIRYSFQSITHHTNTTQDLSLRRQHHQRQHLSCQ
jgi:hypothetical protein